MISEEILKLYDTIDMKERILAATYDFINNKGLMKEWKEFILNECHIEMTSDKKK